MCDCKKNFQNHLPLLDTVAANSLCTPESVQSELLQHLHPCLSWIIVAQVELSQVVMVGVQC